MGRGFRTNQLTFTDAHEILPPQFLLNVKSFIPKTPSTSNVAI
jgi:hypothetical protein